jgi:hypothetical protein
MIKPIFGLRSNKVSPENGGSQTASRIVSSRLLHHGIVFPRLWWPHAAVTRAQTQILDAPQWWNHLKTKQKFRTDGFAVSGMIDGYQCHVIAELSWVRDPG